MFTMIAAKIIFTTILKMSFKDVLLPIMQSEEAAEAHFRQHLCIRRTPPGEETDFVQALTNHYSKLNLSQNKKRSNLQRRSIFRLSQLWPPNDLCQSLNSKHCKSMALSTAQGRIMQQC